MEEYNVSDYGIFNNAITTTTTVNTSIENSKTTINQCGERLKDQSIFMGPIQESAVEGLDKALLETTTLMDNFNTMKEYYKKVVDTYQKGDQTASETVTDTGSALKTDLQTESTDKKNVNTSNIKEGTNVANAVNKYGNEISNAEYATVN